MTPVLAVEGLTVRFGGHVVLSGVSLEAAPGELVGLIGPNGSGKTTLFDAVTGLVRPAAGRVAIGGRDATGLPPHAIARLGVARTFQDLRLFGRMTVLENVAAGQHRAPGVCAWELLAGRPAAERRRRERVRELLALAGLEGKEDVLARHLPLGDQRRLELCRALARDPAVLLLDEPAGGMTPRETEATARLLALAAQGRTVVLIEHKMELVMTLCRRIAVLDGGRKIAEGPPAAVRADPAVIDAYLGRDAEPADARDR